MQASRTYRSELSNIRHGARMKTHAVPFALVLLLGAQHAAAALPDPRYGANLLLQNSGIHLYEGQASVGASLTNTVGGSSLTTAGIASFDDSDASVTSGFTVSPAFTQGWAVATTSDTLTFHVASGGSSQVHVSMAGIWNAQGVGGKVDYELYLGSSIHYGGYAFATGLTESFANGTPVAPAFSFDSGDYVFGVEGTYGVDALFNVVDGGVYTIGTALRADSLGGIARAFINDPLTIELAPGVTFTAASNSTYAVAAVPEPSTWFLMSAGLLGVGWLHRRRRNAI